MTKRDKLQIKFHLISFTVKVLIISYFVFVGIQLLFLYAYGGVKNEAVQTDGSGFFGHNYCGTFFIDITRDNSFADEASYLKAMEPAEIFTLKNCVMAVMLVIMIIFLLVFMHRADKQTLLKKRSAWLMTMTGIIYAAGSTYAEFEKLFPDTNGFKGIMASQTYYPQIVYSVYGIVFIILAYSAVLFHYEQLSREKSTSLSRFNLKALSVIGSVITFSFMLWRFSVRVYEIVNAIPGGDHNARLPFYSVLLDLPRSDAVSEDAYINILVFRLIKDVPVFAAAAAAVVLTVKFMLSSAEGEINTGINRGRLKKAALALAAASICFNLLGLIEAELIRDSFTGIYSTAQYTIGIRAGCEPMLFAFLIMVIEVYLQAIPNENEREIKSVGVIKMNLLEKSTALSGGREEKVLQCLKKAGWHKKRRADITEVEEWYARWSIALSEPVKDIFREYYGLAEAWWFNADEDDMNSHGSDFELFLFPSVSGENYLSDIDSEGKFVNQKAAETAAGESLVFIGYAGCSYPDFLFASKSGVIWTADGDKYDDISDVVKHHFSMHYNAWKSVRMRQYEEWK
ncbi:MAG: SUKH-3 domain-containing protein [Oscillospiraceae bacterium]|nr:SUKH-3 domain-containing protein [Oscillospiraceae bacterium]